MDPVAAHRQWVLPRRAATSPRHSGTEDQGRPWGEMEGGGREARIAGATRTLFALPTCPRTSRRPIWPSFSGRLATSQGSTWQWIAPLERAEGLHSSRLLTGMSSWGLCAGSGGLVKEGRSHIGLRSLKTHVFQFCMSPYSGRMASALSALSMAMAMDTLSSRLNGQLLGKLGRWSSRLRLKTKIYELGFDATWIRKSVGRVPSCQQRCRSKKKKGTSEGGG